MQPHRLLFSMAAAASVLSLLAPAILAQPDQPIDQRVALYLGQPTDDNMLTPPPKATLAEVRPLVDPPPLLKTHPPNPTPCTNRSEPPCPSALFVNPRLCAPLPAPAA